MGKFRKGPIAKRLSTGAIALFALVLQAFIATAAPGTPFDSLPATSCAQAGSGSQMPGNEQHQHHPDCCILACAACGCAYLAVVPGFVAFTVRNISTIIWSPPPRLAVFPSPRRNFSARGPPIL